MKLCGLIPNFYIHVSGSDLYIPTMGLTGNSVFLYCMREISAKPPGGQRRVLPSAPTVERRPHINDQRTNFKFLKITTHKWKN